MPALYSRISTCSLITTVSMYCSLQSRRVQSNLNNFVNVTGWGAFAEILNTYSVIDALRGHSSVHIILLSDWATLCWPALFKDLARQPGGAPSVRVTSINFVFPDPGNSEVPQSTILGEELRRAAHALGVPLVYQPLRVPHFSFHPGLVRTDPAEAVAVVSAWHLMIFPDSRVLKSNPRNAMLKVCDPYGTVLSSPIQYISV